MHFFLSSTDYERSQLNATKMSPSRLIHLTVKRNIYCSLAKKVEDRSRKVVNHNRGLGISLCSSWQKHFINTRVHCIATTSYIIYTV